MHKKVIFFEYEGGQDKGEDGHRPDTMPMIRAIRKKGWEASVLYYTDTNSEAFLEILSSSIDAYISRINPGYIPGGETVFFDMLRNLSDKGVLGMPNPDTMVKFGSKDALVKLRDTSMVPDDTYAYYTVKEFKGLFPKALTYNERVLKQNRGSAGSGIWHVRVEDNRPYKKGDILPGDTQLCCVEAVDNKTYHYELEPFMEFCEQYIIGRDGMLVDMPFLPRIKEGEIRILFVGPNPIFVVHKKPVAKEGAFSATLFSGARYTYDPPEKWTDLINEFQGNFDMICKTLDTSDVPLIWTVDFILDTDEHGKDIYILGEMNCSCVGFTSHLDMGIQDLVADYIIETLTKHNE